MVIDEKKYICHELQVVIRKCKYILTYDLIRFTMENTGFNPGHDEAARSMVSRISNFLFLAVCIFMLIGLSLLLFDRGAVMIAEEMVSSNSSILW